MIASVADFIRYFESIRRSTWAVVDRVTPDLIDWAPRAGEFTCGEIVRHLAGAERFYVAKVIDDRWTSDLEPGPPLDHAATCEGDHLRGDQGVGGDHQVSAAQEGQRPAGEEGC